MPENNWSHRVNPRNAPPDLQDIRSAARDLGNEAHHLTGQTGVVFKSVSHCIILASVLATTSLAIYHLWKELARKAHRDHGHD